MWFFSRSLANSRRTTKRPSVFEQLATNAIDPHHKTDCFEQLAINAIGPRHVKEHLFFDPFSHFFQGGTSVFFGIQILVLLIF